MSISHSATRLDSGRRAARRAGSLRMNRRTLSHVLGALLLVGLAENWRLALWTFRIRELLGILVGLTWWVLTIASLVGLFRVRRWGAYSFLVLAPFSTIMLGTPLFPGMHLVGLRG